MRTSPGRSWPQWSREHASHQRSCSKEAESGLSNEMAAPAQFRVIGQPIPRVEGVDKILGRARYAADFWLPGTLWATTLYSPLAHARIVAMDISRAQAIPGVRAVLTGADFPGRLHGRVLRDIPFLCGERVRFAGDKIAVVAAETREAAEEALASIEVEYEELPAVLD